MAGSCPGENSTSTTGPMTCAIFPMFAIMDSFVPSLTASSLGPRLAALQAFPEPLDLGHVVRVMVDQVRGDLAGAECAEGLVRSRARPGLAPHDPKQGQVARPEDPELLQRQAKVLAAVPVSCGPAILIPDRETHLV